jgi:hypothetical protein
MKRTITFFLLSVTASAQSEVLTYTPPASVSTARGGKTDVVLSLRIAPGYHANSNKPNDSYLIPMSLTWNDGPLKPISVKFPKPETERLGFSTRPVSVFTGSFDLVTHLQAAADAAPGSASIVGKLHYQACNDHTCLTPRTIEIRVPVEIVK